MQTRLALLAGTFVILVACQDSGPAPEPLAPTAPAAAHAEGHADAGPPLHAEVEFGIEEGSVGSAFPPGSHDRSFHSFDKLRPSTVVIQAGGSVTFEVYPFHQPAVYAPGIRPEDIDTGATEPISINGQELPFPLVRITDSEGRIGLAPPQSLEEIEWTFTFEEPGRYLVICTTWVHFTEARMYGWVIVQ